MSRSMSSKRNILINKMKKDTKFTEQFECENLLKKYDELCAETGYPLDRTPFRDFMFQTFGITEDLLLDRVFKAFDLDNDNRISMEEWITGMSTFLRGTISSRTKFCFNVYDMNSDGFISRDEMFILLKKCLQNSKIASDEDPDEGIKELVELVMKKMKKHEHGHPAGDVQISYKEFHDAILDGDELMMECLGQCLPTEKKIEDFETTVILSRIQSNRHIKGMLI